jgi:translation initiation factor IF-3
VRLIDSDGTDLGVVTIAEALRRASAAGFKIAEINTRVEPVVCKIMNDEQFELHLRATQGSAN